MFKGFLARAMLARLVGQIRFFVMGDEAAGKITVPERAPDPPDAGGPSHPDLMHFFARAAEHEVWPYIEIGPNALSKVWQEETAATLAAECAALHLSSEQPREPDLASLRPVVRAFSDIFVALNRSAGVPEPVASLLWANCLGGSVLVVPLLYRGEVDAAAQCILRVWQVVATTLGGVRPWTAGALPVLPAAHHGLAELATQDAVRFIPTFALAVSELAANLAARNDARDVRDQLRAHLALNDADMERALGACGELQSSPEAHAYVASAGAALDRLLHLFKPESLAQVIRRPAELFDGKRALDWILEGRIAEVADRYDVALSYQA